MTRDWIESRTVPRPSRPELVLGGLVLLVGVGYGALTFARGGFETEFALLTTGLGTLLGVVLLGEYFAPQSGADWYRRLVCPAAELLTTYSLLGVVVFAFYGGYADVGIVSGLLLLFSFLAIVLTSRRVRDDV